MIVVSGGVKLQTRTLTRQGRPKSAPEILEQIGLRSTRPSARPAREES
jgi:hypothetical protein